jgi:hypothetical protein
MWPGFDRLTAEELYDKYREKVAESYKGWQEHDKVVDKNLKVLFKRSNRLRFRVNNMFYGLERPETPKNLQLGVKSKLGEGLAAKFKEAFKALVPVKKSKKRRKQRSEAEGGKLGSQRGS